MCLLYHHLFYNTLFVFGTKDVLSWTILGHLAVTLIWMELNIKIALWQKTSQPCKYWLAVFLSSLKTFKLVKLMAGKELEYFYLMSAEVWMNLRRQVIRKSTPRVSSRTGAIQSKLINFCTIENFTCDIFKQSKSLHRIINFMQHKSQIYFSELVLYGYLNI